MEIATGNTHLHSYLSSVTPSSESLLSEMSSRSILSFVPSRALEIEHFLIARRASFFFNGGPCVSEPWAQHRWRGPFQSSGRFRLPIPHLAVYRPLVKRKPSRWMPFSLAISLPLLAAAWCWQQDSQLICSWTKSVSCRPMLGKTPFFLPRKLILVLLHSKRASFFFHQLRKLRSFPPNCRPAALLPIVSAAEIAFLSKAPECSTAFMVLTVVEKLGCSKRWPSRTGKIQLQVPMVTDRCGARKIENGGTPRQAGQLLVRLTPYCCLFGSYAIFMGEKNLSIVGARKALMMMTVPSNNKTGTANQKKKTLGICI